MRRTQPPVGGPRRQPSPKRVRGATSLADSQIAGIAKSNGHAVATLNAGDFENAEVDVVECARQPPA